MGEQNSVNELEARIPQRYLRRQQGSRTLNIPSTSPPLPRLRMSQPTTPDGSPTRPPSSGSFEGHANALIGDISPLTAHHQSRNVDQRRSPMMYPSGIGIYLDAPNASQVNITNIVHQSSEHRTGDDALSHTPPGSPHRVPISSTRYSSRTIEGLSTTGDRNNSAWDPSASFNQSFGFQSSSSSSSGSTQAADDRIFLPPQLDKSPSGVFTPDAKHIPSRHGPGAKMVRISPIQRNSNAANTSAIPHPRFTSMDQRVEMLTPPTSKLGTSFKAPSADAKVAEGSSTPNFNASRVHGHRRNKTTISDLSAVAQLPASERLTPPKFEFGSSAVALAADMKDDSPSDQKLASPPFKYEYAQQAKAGSNHPTVSGWEIAETQLGSQGVDDLITATNSMRLDPVQEHLSASAPPNEEDLISFNKVRHQRTTSDQSTASVSTVASDSWNPVDAFVPSAEDLSELSNKASGLQLAYQQGFGLDLERLASEEVREIYPYDQYVLGGGEHGIAVHDFGYPANHSINTAAASKHVRFASKSDHAPSAHHKSDSDGSGGSKATTLSLIDLDGCKVEEDVPDCDQDVGAELTDESHGDIVQSATEYRQPTLSPLIDQFPLPPTAHEPTTLATLRIVDEDEANHSDDASDSDISIYTALATRPPVDLRFTTSERTESPDSENYDYVPPIKVNKLRPSNSQPTQHKRSSSAGFLRRISGHISSFMGARQGLELKDDPLRNQVFMGGNGVLDREFQFPARVAALEELRAVEPEELRAAEPEEQRVVSEPLLTAPAQPHKRSSSFGRLLGKFGGKGGKGGKQAEKDEDSVGRRLSVHFSEVFSFRNVFDEGLWHGMAGV